MSYPIFNAPPPYDRSFYEMTKSEIRTYYDWFLNNLDERLKILRTAVKKTKGFEAVNLDLTATSLPGLGSWYLDQVSSKLQDTKRKKLAKGLNEARPLSAEVFSMAADTGIYFGSVFTKNHHSIIWCLEVRNKRDINYGQPVLSGFGTGRMNPVRIMINFAYEIAENPSSRCDFLETYQFWRQLISD